MNLSLVPRPLPHFQCTLNTADDAEESDPFTDIEEDNDELENELVLDHYYPYTVNVGLTSHTQFTVALSSYEVCQYVYMLLKA